MTDMGGRPNGGGEQGFTLVELLVVVIIVGILAAIAIPVFLNQRGKASDAAAQTDVRNMAQTQFAVMADTGTFSGTIAGLVAEGFNPSVPAATQHGVCVLNPASDQPEFVMAARHEAGTATMLMRSNEGWIVEDPSHADVTDAIQSEAAGCTSVDRRP